MRRSTRPSVWWAAMGIITLCAVAFVPDRWFPAPVQYAAAFGFLGWFYRDKLLEWSKREEAPHGT